MATLEDFFVQPHNSTRTDSLSLEHTPTEDILDEYSRFTKQLRKRFSTLDDQAGYMKILYPLFLSCLGEGIRNECPATVIRRFYEQHANCFLHDPSNVATIQAVMEASPSSLGTGWPGPRTFDITLSDEENRQLCCALESEEFFQMALMFDKLVTLAVTAPAPPSTPTQHFGKMTSTFPSSSTRSVGTLHVMRTNLDSLTQIGGSAAPLHVHHISVPNCEPRLSCAAVSANRHVLVCGAEQSGLLLRPLSSGAFLAELPEPSPVGVSRAHLARESCLSLGRHTAPIRGRRAAQEEASGVRWLRAHRGPVTDVRFIDGERFLLSASTDKTVRLWDALLGENIVIYNRHSKAVLVCDVSSPLSMFASGSMDTVCHVWSTERMIPVRTFVGHEGPVQDANFHPNSKSMATCSEVDGLRLWDVGSGRMVVHMARQLQLPIDADGENAPRVPKEPVQVGFNRVSWSPCGINVALLGASPRRKGGPILSVYDMRALMTPIFSARLPAPGPSSCRPAWSHDGTTLGVAARDGGVLMWAPFSDPNVPKTEAPLFVRHPVDRRRVQSALSISCFSDNSCYVVGQAARSETY